MGLFSRKPKTPKEIVRIDVADNGEAKYCLTHRFTLENYREYNLAVSAPAIERDKKVKRILGLVMGVVALGGLVMGIINFIQKDMELIEKHGILSLFNYGSSMLHFAIFLMAGFLCYHLLTFYQKFDKRLEKATAEYYNSTRYLKNDLTLAVYETGVLEKAIVRDEFFQWEQFERCWETENIVYLQFTLANQLFVSKEALLANGIDKDEFMKFCSEHIEEARRLAAERAEAEEAAEEAEEAEFKENERKIKELEEEEE